MTDPPSNREFQVLAIMASKQETLAEPAELSGRQIAKLFEQGTDETVTYGMVYSILADLEDAGRVQSRDEVTGGRPTRWFRLTAGGLDAMRQGPRPAPPTPSPDDRSVAKPTGTDP